MRTRRVRRSSRKGAVAFADCEVSSNEDFSQLLGAVEKSKGAEYPVQDSPKTVSRDVEQFGDCVVGVDVLDDPLFFADIY